MAGYCETTSRGDRIVDDAYEPRAIKKRAGDQMKKWPKLDGVQIAVVDKHADDGLIGNGLLRGKRMLALSEILGAARGLARLHELCRQHSMPRVAASVDALRGARMSVNNGQVRRCRGDAK
jgi:hypothetical protein